MASSLPERRAATLYEQGLLRARRTAFAITKEAEERLLVAYSDAISRLAAEASTGVISRTRMYALVRHFRAIMTKFEGDFALITERSQAVTLKRILEIHQEVLDQLLPVAPKGMRISRATMVRPQIIASILSRGTGPRELRSLFKYHLSSSALREVDTFLASAVSRGVSPTRAAKDLARIMAADDPRLNRALDAKIGGRGRLTKAVIAEYGLKPQDVTGLKTLFYDARRITVSETLNTLRETNARALVESPVVLAAQWQRSGRHRSVSYPDECDVLAESDLYGYGPGYYIVEAWPLAPHPHCGCTQGAVLLRPPSQWGQPKPQPRPRKVAPEKAPLKPEWTEKWSPLRQKRVRERMKQVNDVGIMKPVSHELAGRKAPTPKPAPAPPAPPVTPFVPGYQARTLATASDTRAMADSLRARAAEINRRASQAGGYGSPGRAQAMAEQIANELQHTHGAGRKVNNNFLFSPQVDAKYGVDAWASWNDTISYNSAVSRMIGNLDLEDALHWTPDDVRAFRIMVHERIHVNSPMRLHPDGISKAVAHYVNEAGRIMEEAIVEYKARQVTAMFMRGPEGNWYAMGAQGSYGREVTGLRIFIREFGEDAMEEIWRGTTLEERLAAAAPRIRERFRERIRATSKYKELEASPHTKQRVDDLERAIDGVSDEYWVENMERALNTDLGFADDLRMMGELNRRGQYTFRKAS